MRYMRWSWDAYVACPGWLRDFIVQQMVDEVERRKADERKRR